jgi:hypothetical protein
MGTGGFDILTALLVAARLGLARMVSLQLVARSDCAGTGRKVTGTNKKPAPT